MKLVEDKPDLTITPDAIFAKDYIQEHIKRKGTFQLHDSIKEAVSGNGGSLDNLSFKFNGVYPNIFKNSDEALQFKDALDALVIKTNNDPSNLKVKNIDDVLFITYFIAGYDGDVYGSNMNDKYLKELEEVFICLLDRDLTPTEGDYIWMPDPVTGIEAPILKSHFREDELKMNGGYKTVSRMIGPNNKVFHFPGDSPIVLVARSNDIRDIPLPIKLAEKITSVIVDHIIKEHKAADSKFYEELCGGHLDTKKEREGFRWHKRKNKVLFYLIEELKSYFNNATKFKPVKKSVLVFIYDLFKILKLVEPPYKINSIDKYSVIKTILRDNSTPKGK